MLVGADHLRVCGEERRVAGRRWREGRRSNEGAVAWRLICPAAGELTAATPAKLRDDAGDEGLRSGPGSAKH